MDGNFFAETRNLILTKRNIEVADSDFHL